MGRFLCLAQLIPIVTGKMSGICNLSVYLLFRPFHGARQCISKLFTSQGLAREESVLSKPTFESQKAVAQFLSGKSIFTRSRAAFVSRNARNPTPPVSLQYNPDRWTPALHFRILEVVSFFPKFCQYTPNYLVDIQCVKAEEIPIF